MKTSSILSVGLVAGMVGLGLAGCKKVEDAKTTAPTEMQKKAETVTPAPAPADQKPKDHPAH